MIIASNIVNHIAMAVSVIRGEIVKAETTSRGCRTQHTGLCAQWERECNSGSVAYVSAARFPAAAFDYTPFDEEVIKN